MNDLLTQYAGTPVKDIHSGPLREMLQTLIAEADYVMGTDLDDSAQAGMTKWLLDFLYNKYGYIAFMHIREAFRAGALGQRGGTSKLIPRNVIIWISEQDKIYQEQRMTDMRKVDEDRRRREMNGGRAHPNVGKAVLIKVTWLAKGMITGDQYDSFSSKVIFDLLESGVPEGDIHPRDVVPNYGKKAS